MRVALLSLLEAASGQREPEPRGLLSFGGRTIAHVQLELALSLGCERIVCLAHGLCPGLVALQRAAEKTGAHFHLIPSPRLLASLVRGGDELLVFADGVLPLSVEAGQTLGTGPAVLVLPAEIGVTEGFERIDLNHAWAGALAMPGALVERLYDLPEDVDTVGALLRIALQARIPERALPDAVLAEGGWALVKSAGEAELQERAWVRREAEIADPRQPGRWLASQIVARFAPTMLQRGIGSPVLGVASVVWLLVALAVARWCSVPAGLAVLILAAMTRKAGDAMRRLEGREHDRFSRVFAALLWLIDLGLIAILSLGVAGRWPDRLYAPLVLVGLSRLLPIVQKSRWGGISADRALGAGVLALCATAGVLDPAIKGLSLLLLALAILSAREQGG